jgi:hypothetical protein
MIKVDLQPIDNKEDMIKGKMEGLDILQHTGAQINASLGLPLTEKGFTIESREAMSYQMAQQKPRARAQAPNVFPIFACQLEGNRQSIPTLYQNLLNSSYKYLILGRVALLWFGSGCVLKLGI